MTLRLKLILIGEGYLMHSYYYYMYIEVSGILYRVKMIKDSGLWFKDTVSIILF